MGRDLVAVDSSLRVLDLGVVTLWRRREFAFVVLRGFAVGRGGCDGVRGSSALGSCDCSAV